MEKDRKDQMKQGDVIAEAEVVSQRLSIPELAGQLESGHINPATLSKKVLRGCALFFKSMKYENEDIAAILHITVRSVERYLKRIKEENALVLGPDFQKNLVSKIMTSWRARGQRLLRLSYAKDMSSYEMARVISMCHQIDMSEVVLLERLGYLGRERGAADIYEAVETKKQEQLNRYGDMMGRLTKAQRKQVSVFIDKEHEESEMRDEAFRDNLSKMIKCFDEENTKRYGGIDDQVFDNGRPETDKPITTCTTSIYTDACIKKPTETTVTAKSDQSS